MPGLGVDDDDEELGAVLQPAKRVSKGPRKRPQSLAPHPAVEGVEGSCALCCRPARGYRHPNPLRPGVILWRCFQHRGPRFAVDDPKAAPGGGLYK